MTMPHALRRVGRTIRRELSVLKYRIRTLLGREIPAKIVPVPARSPCPPSPHPAVRIAVPPEVDEDHFRHVLAGQTETSWTLTDGPNGASPWIWCPGPGAGNLEASHLESLVITGAALDLDVTIGGWSVPEGSTGRPEDVDSGSLTLLRNPVMHSVGGSIQGVSVPQIAATNHQTTDVPPVHRSSSFFLNTNGGSGAVIRLPVHNVHARLSDLPSVAGPPTVLFVMPYLAVGGAENLLFDLIDGLTPDQRVLVVTLDPHRKELGQTVDQCRRLTPHVYTLGDWVPREARLDTLRHLIRRWQVEVLVSWNGTVDFYDNALDLRRQFPSLRIFAQLYNHEGGWIDRTTPALLKHLDGHLGVNDRISRALIKRGASPDRVHTVHHGVRVPPQVPAGERSQRCRALRREINLPEDAVVVGTFIRLHRQKRPLDIVRLARRLEDSGLYFLLVGGGPETEAVNAEIRCDPPSNLVCLPLQTETLHLYDALDICLMTSEYEGLPVFLLDGLAREIPCVATAVGEIPELLRDGGGILVANPGDLDALAKGLLDLIDQERRQKEGRYGRRTVEARFGLDTYVETYRNLLFPKAGK